MESEAFGKRARGVPWVVLSTALVGLERDIFLLRAALLRQELSLSYAALAWWVAAELLGAAVGTFSYRKRAFVVRRGTVQGLALFSVGNLLTGLSRGAAGLLLAGLLTGLGGCRTVRAAADAAVGQGAVQTVSLFAWRRLAAAVTAVGAPLLGALLLVARGARESAYVSAALAALLLLFLFAASPKCGKSHPVFGDIGGGESVVRTPLPSAMLLPCLARGCLSLAEVTAALFLYLYSGSLLLSGLAVSLLRLSRISLRVAFYA